MSIFGQILSANELEAAVQTTLTNWFKTYARECELQWNIPQDSFPLPKQILVAEEVDHRSADLLPALVIVSPGLAGPPVQEGDGYYTATFQLGVGIFVSSKSRPETLRLVRQYAAIVRAIVLQKNSFGGTADGIAWLDESYDDDFAFVDKQTVSAAQIVLNVDVTHVTNRQMGPPEPDVPDPDTQPGSDWPIAETVSAAVETKE